jgi:cytochrome b subunit of formate dehydrogenase
LFFQVNYPSNFFTAIGELSIFGTPIDLASLPLAALLSISWTLSLVFTLRYCQYSIFVERQYKYLHKLEETISKAIGEEAIYSREGASYLEDYPPFTTWAWIFYVWMFPIIVIISSGVLLYIEMVRGPHAWPYKAYDILMGMGIAISYILYRLGSAIKGKSGNRGA